MNVKFHLLFLLLIVSLTACVQRTVPVHADRSPHAVGDYMGNFSVPRHRIDKISLVKFLMTDFNERDSRVKDVVDAMHLIEVKESQSVKNKGLVFYIKNLNKEVLFETELRYQKYASSLVVPCKQKRFISILLNIFDGQKKTIFLSKVDQLILVHDQHVECFAFFIPIDESGDDSYYCTLSRMK